jgi:CTP synthase
VPERAVISAADVDVHLQDAAGCTPGLDEIVIDQLKLRDKARPTCRVGSLVDAVQHPLDEVTIAVVGKYVDHQDAYKSSAKRSSTAACASAPRST